MKGGKTEPTEIIVEKEITTKKVASIPTPTSGYGAIGFKTDGKAYVKNDVGVETEIGLTGGKLIAEDSGCGLDNGSTTRGTVGTNAVSLEYSSSGSNKGATGARSFACGTDTTASGISSFAANAVSVASSVGAFACGFSTAKHPYEFSHGSTSSQTGWIILYSTTSSTSQSELLLSASPLRLTLDDGDAYSCLIHFMGKQADGSMGAVIKSAKIKREGATTSLTGTVKDIDAWEADTGLGTPTIAIEADDTNNALVVKVTPANTTETRWTAKIEYVKINF